MKWFAFLPLTFAATSLAVAADDLTGQSLNAALNERDPRLPSCAAQCVETLAPKHGCEISDIECLCSNQGLTTALGACVGSECSIIDALATQKNQTISCGAPIRDESELARRTLWSLFAVSLLAIGLRFVARAPWFNGPGFGLDDAMMLVVLAFLFPHEIGLEIMIQNGLGQDLWMLTPSQITLCLKYFWTGEMFYTCVIMATKISILFLYCRIFPSTVTTYFRTACFVLIGVCASAAIGMVLALVFECQPISGAYKKWDGEHPTKCIDTNAQVIAMAAINIVLDLLVFFLPIPKVLKLHASKRKRFGICLTFLVGLFVTAVSIVRLVAIVKNIGTANPTYDFNSIGIWTQAEVNVGVLCACMPAFAGLIKRCWAATIGGYVSTKLDNLSATVSRISYKKHPGPEENDLRHLPTNGVAKTIDTSIVFDRRVDSTDEVELMDESSQQSLNSSVGQHKYIREWGV